MNGDSIFGHPVGTCDRCGTPGLKLYEYEGKDVCAACLQVLLDYEKREATEAAYKQLHNLISHAKGG
ncbi:MAG: hypothetical protein DRJ60_02330 [Thermoprotei archaeon]|nr:MAG: hypothetical protein DRJ60_02330 [Thermoprotei archaeon]